MVKNNTRMYVTSFEAATMLGFTPDYIRRLIARGKIKAEKLGHNWLINPVHLRKIKPKKGFKRDFS